MASNNEVFQNILTDIGNNKSVRFKFGRNEYLFKPENDKIMISKNGVDLIVISNDVRDADKVLNNIINNRNIDLLVDTFEK